MDSSKTAVTRTRTESKPQDKSQSRLNWKHKLLINFAVALIALLIGVLVGHLVLEPNNKSNDPDLVIKLLHNLRDGICSFHEPCDMTLMISHQSDGHCNLSLIESNCRKVFEPIDLYIQDHGDLEVCMKKTNTSEDRKIGVIGKVKGRRPELQSDQNLRHRLEAGAKEQMGRAIAIYNKVKKTTEDCCVIGRKDQEVRRSEVSDDDDD